MARAVRNGSRLDSVLLVACCAVSVITMVLPAPMRDRTSMGIRRWVMAPLVSLQREAELMRATFLAHDTTVGNQAAIQNRLLETNALESENARLRSMLGLATRVRNGFVTAEALHSRGPGDDFTLTLTAGSSAGVRPYTPVVTKDGLVGLVQTVDPTISLAIMWAHPDFRVSAMAVDESAFGIVQPHLASGAERYLLEMRGVPYRASLKPGTLIVSSGLGAVYPRGIPIGTVLGEVRTPEQWARTYLLRPSVQPANIAQVMLLLPTRVAAGVRDVWTSVPSADSATRAIVAAGDSALRETAMAEVRARRAALDSTGGDSLQADSTRADSVTPRAAVPARPVPPRTDSAPRTAPAGAPVRRDSTRPIPPAATVPRPATTTTPRPPVTRSPDTSRRPPAAPATKRP